MVCVCVRTQSLCQDKGVCVLYCLSTSTCVSTCTSASYVFGSVCLNFDWNTGGQTEIQGPSQVSSTLFKGTKIKTTKSLSDQEVSRKREPRWVGGWRRRGKSRRKSPLRKDSGKTRGATSVHRVERTLGTRTESRNCNSPGYGPYVWHVGYRGSSKRSKRVYRGRFTQD